MFRHKAVCATLAQPRCLTTREYIYATTCPAIRITSTPAADQFVCHVK